MAFTTRDLQFPNQYQVLKSEKYETFCVSKLLIWRQKWVTGIRHGKLARSSSGVLFRTKYAVYCQSYHGILELTIRRGQRNFSIVFIFVSCEEKCYYGIVSVEQLILECRSYCGRSRRMQGITVIF